jgi:hypothetical protein
MQRASSYTSQDTLILEGDISKRRKRQLLDEYLLERQRAQVVERLFDRVGAYIEKRLPAPETVKPFGFSAIVFKGPFVEGANWTHVNARHLARVQEDHLLRQLELTLRSAAIQRQEDAIFPSMRSIVAALDGMMHDLRWRGYEPSLLVLAGQIDQDVYDDLGNAVYSSGNWCHGLGLPHQAAQHLADHLIGVHAEMPFLGIDESPTPMLYAVDLARFATLIRYGEPPEFGPKFDVREITADDARAILARQPKLILDPPPESGMEAERIREMQLRARLELWETYEIKVKDPNAVVARPLAEPRYDDWDGDEEW